MHSTPLPSNSVRAAASVSALIRQLPNVLKLRIGITIAFAALAGWAITPGSSLAGWQVAVLATAVLLSAASAGGFNQFLERDLDARMERTRRRPFASGRLHAHRGWLVFLYAMLFVSVGAAAWALNPVSALYVFLGAFTYAFVYTVWLKRRTWLNIVIGGLAGSFAVLAGAAAVDPTIGPRALWLAVVLFLWTPSHFWSLAIALHDDYARARVPMLPVVIGNRRAARVVLINTVLLVAASLVPMLYGMGWVYGTGAVLGGAWFIAANLRMLRDPSRPVATYCFHASLVQLSLLLTAAVVDTQLVV